MKLLVATLLTFPALLGSLASAQTAGTITFNVNQTSAQGSLIPVLTWSTTPVASSCTASGGWSGTKFASGSETVAKITANTAYTITCSWGGGTATVNWVVPTTNTDGTPLTDLASFKVLYGTNSASLSNNQLVSDPKATSTTISSLGTGTWYFTARAVNSKGVESDDSNMAQRAIAAASAAKTLNVTITAAPPPTTLVRKTIATPVYDVVRTTKWVRGRQVGTIAIGKVCSNTYSVPGNYFGVTRSDVTMTRTPRSTNVVALCKAVQ
jgi:hypothetical protein